MTVDFFCHCNQYVCGNAGGLLNSITHIQYLTESWSYSLM